MATTTLNLPVKRSGQTLGTAVLTVKERTIDVVASIASTNITLPAGRYLLTTMLTSKLTGHEYPTQTQTLDTTIASAQTVSAPASGTLHAHRDFESNASGTVVGMVDVKVWDGSGWRAYATSWTSDAASSVSFSPCGPTNTNQLYGANVHVISSDSTQSAAKTTALLDTLVAMGGDTVRTSSGWIFMEQTQGVIDPVYQSEMDKFFSDAAARNLKVITPWGGASPPWAAPSRPVRTVTTGWNNKTYNWTSYAPDNMQDLIDGLNLWLNRYGSRTYAIEVGNEPNNGNFYSDTVANWVAMTKAIYNTVKASAYPNIKVIGAVLSFCDTDYLQQLYTAGMKGYCDAIGMHPYHFYFPVGGGARQGNPRRPLVDVDFDNGIAGLEDIREVQLANGDTAPIWVTETGFSTAQGQTGKFVGANLSEADQSDFLKYSLRQLARLPYVEVVQIHTMEDGTPSTTWSNHFGISYTDHTTRKPSFTVVKDTWAGLRAGSL